MEPTQSSQPDSSPKLGSTAATGRLLWVAPTVRVLPVVSNTQTGLNKIGKEISFYSRS
ncbi:MAG: hypothetical protein ABJE47_10900 [bacterium]